jgi:hypothetical protein
LDDLLKFGQLWFSHQNELNDPFDCKFALSETFMQTFFERVSSRLLKDIQAGIPQLANMKEQQFAQSTLPIFKSDEWMGGFYDTIFSDKYGWSVCCFSTNPLNELMWAHYADNNRGVCLEFDLSKTPELHEKLFPIEYDDNFPEINSMDDLPDALLRKRTAWTNEEEWRILTNCKGVKPFDKDALTSIYFGCNVTDETINTIRDLMINNGYKQVSFKKLNFRIKGAILSPIIRAKV